MCSDYYRESEVEQYMTPTQFKLATSGLGLSEKSIEVLRRILVNKEPTAAVLRDMDVKHRQQVYEIRKKVLENFEARVRENGLVFREVLMTPEDDSNLNKKEVCIVDEILSSVKERKQWQRRKE